MNSLALKMESLNDNAAAGFQHAGFNIKPIHAKPNAYQLGISGFLAPGWTGRLAAGLAQHRVGIVRGEAEKVTASNWRSDFELKSAPFAKDPLSIDYLHLAGTELPYDRNVGRIALLDFLLEPCIRHEGSLYIQVKGVDRLGFLGDLLDYFSMRCLFPVKMTIDTVADTAMDRFWLRGIGGSIPSDSITASIRENLEQLLIAAR